MGASYILYWCLWLMQRITLIFNINLVFACNKYLCNYCIHSQMDFKSYQHNQRSLIAAACVFFTTQQKFHHDDDRHSTNQDLLFVSGYFDDTAKYVERRLGWKRKTERTSELKKEKKERKKEVQREREREKRKISAVRRYQSKQAKEGVEG